MFSSIVKESAFEGSLIGSNHTPMQAGLLKIYIEFELIAPGWLPRSGSQSPRFQIHCSVVGVLDG